jgi:hypothetical protein
LGELLAAYVFRLQGNEQSDRRVANDT